MGYLDSFKEFMFRKPISEPDTHPDKEYTKHAETKRFEQSPTGRMIRELEAIEAQQDTSVNLVPSEPVQQGNQVFMDNSMVKQGKRPPEDKTNYRRGNGDTRRIASGKPQHRM